MQAKVRTATIEDAEAINRVNILTWQSSYRGIFPDKFLANLPIAKRLKNICQFFRAPPPQSAAFVVEVPIVGIAGFAFGGKAREVIQDYDGELYGLYILQEYQRHRLGRLLLKNIATHLEVRRFTKMFAWTLTVSPYTAFYRGLGAIECGKQIREFGPVSKELVAFGWPSISDLLARLEILVN